MTHNKWFFPFLLALAFLAAPASAQTTAAADKMLPPPATNPALEEIGQMRQGLLDAFTKKDVDKMLTYLHPDIVITWQDGSVTKGKDEFKTYYAKMMTGPDAIVDSITATPVVEGRTINGDTAISFGHMGDTFKLKDGMEFHLDSRFSAWLVRDNGKWLVRGFHLSGNIFDNDVQKIYIRKTATWTGIAAGAIGLVLGLLIGRAMRRAPAKA